MPLAERPWLAAVAIAYAAVVLAIGLWSARRTRDARDFFIAGQSLGLTLVTLATMSAAFSGFVFLGGPGLTYRLGLGSLWIVLPVGFTGGLLCWVVGLKLRRLAGVRELFTVPDLLSVRFGRRAAAWGAGAVAAGTVVYLAAQLLALGVLLRGAFGVDSLALAVWGGAAVVLVYAAAGGMLAGVWTDVVQGGLMLVAAGAVFVVAIGSAGGWSEIVASISGSERFGPAFLAPTGRLPLEAAAGMFFVFGLGVLGQPQMLHKFFMVSDERTLRWFPLTLGVTQLVCLLIWVGVGLSVPALVAQARIEPLANPDDVAGAFMMQVAPDWLAGLVLAGVLAAIMSTADSFVTIGAAAIVRDLPRAIGRPLTNELRWTRVAVVGVGAAAAGLALVYGDLIALLGTFAFGVFGAALAPALALGLAWRQVGERAACASIATGLFATLGLELAGRIPALAWLPPHAGVPPSAWALALSFAVLVLVTRLDREPSPLDPEIAAIIDG